MIIQVRAFGLLQEQLGGSSWSEVDVSENITIEGLIVKLGIDKEMVMNVVKDGKLLSWDYIIEEEDKLQILPFISGG